MSLIKDVGRLTIFLSSQSMRSHDSLVLWLGLLAAVGLAYLLGMLILLLLKRKKQKQTKEIPDITAELPPPSEIFEAMGFCVEEDITFFESHEKI